MFQVTEDTSGEMESVRITNTDSGEYVSIFPRFGANVNELVLQKNGTLYSVLAGNTDPDDFKGTNIFKGAKLLPFPNRLKDGEYIFGEGKYYMCINYPEEHNACHGFMYEMEFIAEDPEEYEEYAAVNFFCLYDGSLPGYPFPFKVLLDYTLSAKDGFSCRTRIENMGNNEMPLGDGWHPFLTLHRKIDGLLLRVKAEHRIEVDDRRIPMGFTEPYVIFNDLTPIGDLDLDTCLKISPDSNGRHITELYDPGQDLKLVLWQDTGKNKYNYLQIYTPPDRMSVAIEPMTCNIDAFNNHDGLIVLGKAQSFDAKYGIKLE
jgi:aldose 1-epimerase